MPKVLAHAPFLLGLLLNNVNNNNPAGVYASYAATVVIHEQIAEATYLRGMREFQDFVRFLYRSSGKIPTSLFFPIIICFAFYLQNFFFSHLYHSTDQPIAKFVLAN